MFKVFHELFDNQSFYPIWCSGQVSCFSLKNEKKIRKQPNDSICFRCFLNIKHHSSIIFNFMLLFHFYLHTFFRYLWFSKYKHKKTVWKHIKIHISLFVHSEKYNINMHKTFLWNANAICFCCFCHFDVLTFQCSLLSFDWVALFPWFDSFFCKYEGISEQLNFEGIKQRFDLKLFFSE